MRLWNKKISIFVLVSVIAIGTVSLSEKHFKISKNLEIFASLFKELNTYYVDEVQPGKLMEKGIKSMINSLDPYTKYYSESEVEDYKFQTTGKYGGIGARIQRQGKYVTIVAPYVGYPAYESGLRAGDKIIEIDGKSAEGKSTEEVSNILKGTPGTTVKVTVERPPFNNEKTVSIEREKIKINSVAYKGTIKDSVGYIKLRSFTRKAGKEIRNAVQSIQEENNLSGIILDLRNNPGGLLNEAVNVANVFIEKGQTIVSTKGKIKQWEKTYKTTNKAVDDSIPYTVLVNGNSASASEIVAGATQDLDRGVIIGRQTYGKGLVQTTRPLAYNAKLKVTTAKYYIPSGRCIQSVQYSGKKGNGKEIPDSLKTKFTTQNGRVVYDSDGIVPDIKVDPRKLRKISQVLIAKNHIFDYATIYKSKHDSIVSPREFTITDKEYEDFKEFMEDRDYSYTTKSEKQLKQLEKSAQKEKYYDAIEDELKELEKNILHDKSKDLEKFKEQIKNLLEEEIVSRYYYRKGKTEAKFDHDKDIKKALEILSNKNRYHEILQVNK